MQPWRGNVSVVAFYRCFHGASSTVTETTSEITSQTQQGIQCSQGDGNSGDGGGGDDGGDDEWYDDGDDDDGGKNSRSSCFTEVLS